MQPDFPDPWAQLRRSLLRAGLLIILMSLGTAGMIWYMKVQYEKIAPPGPIIGPLRTSSQGISTGPAVPKWAELILMSTVAQTSPAPTPAPAPSAPTLGSDAKPTGFSSVDDSDDIRDVDPPIFYNYWSLWIGLLFAAMVVAALLAYLIYLLIAHLRAETPVSRHERTRKELQEVYRLLDAQNSEPYARAVSEIIRNYIGWRFGIASGQQTTAEFLQQLTRNPHTPLAGHQMLLQNFLQACDLVKFAQYHPEHNELLNVQNSAVRFVEATHPNFTNIPVYSNSSLAPAKEHLSA